MRPATAPVERFLEAVAEAVRDGRLQALVLANPRATGPDLPRRVDARLLQLRGATVLSLRLRHPTRDVTRNLAPDEVAAALLPLLAPAQADEAAAATPAAPRPAAGGEVATSPAFAHAHLARGDAQLDLRISRKGRAALQQAGASAAPGAPPVSPPATAPAPTAHDRAKRRWLDPASPWLHALGVTDAQGQVLASMSRKWKQINKFVEVLDAGWRDAGLSDRGAGAPPLRVMDFGAGKGYLTFAVSAWLNGQGQASEVIGVELREALVALGNAAARAGGEALRGLRFEQGDVMHHATGALDAMIALHACDTATDHAIHKGIVAGARLIVCSPCCHRELRPQLRSPGVLAPMLQHGIHLGQQAEMITDSLRALLLEAHGYRSQVFEFVALEHTSKNKMILAVKRDGPPPAQPAYERIRAIKEFYGVREQCLETLLAGAQP